MTRARHGTGPIAAYIGAGRREPRNGGHGKANILAGFLIKHGSSLDVIELAQSMLVLGSEREHSTVLFSTVGDAKSGSKDPISVWEGLRK